MGFELTTDDRSGKNIFPKMKSTKARKPIQPSNIRRSPYGFGGVTITTKLGQLS